MNIHAYIVSVDYSDLLNITLPYNKHHFKSVTVITTREDKETRAVAYKNDCACITSDIFYSNGACFNKYAALDATIRFHKSNTKADYYVCVIDADILLPKEIEWHFLDDFASTNCLFTPERFMCRDVPDIIPQEPYWRSYPKHRDVEWAGYTQIFHTSDSHLENKEEWYPVNWTHAGGADSEFQAYWPQSHKKRPPFSVLHLGKEGVNWCGRVTPTLKGDEFHQAEHRRANMKFMRDKRKATGNYDHEKL